MHDPTPNPAFVLLQSSASAALQCLSGPELTDTRVHEARKALKSARTALRLLRPRLDDAEYRQANRELRNAGRCLSPLRDAQALLALLARTKARDAAAERALGSLRAAIDAELDTRRTALADVRQRRRCTALIDGVRERLARAELAQADGRILRHGFRAIYRRARKAYAGVRRAPDAARLHEWRKQTKYLRTAAELLAHAGVRGLSKNGARAERVTDLLGDAHDLTVLEARLREYDDGRAAALCAQLERRRGKLERRALALGARLFERAPQHFVPAAARFRHLR